MNFIQSFLSILAFLLQFVKLHFKSSHELRLENIALKSQLSIYHHHYQKSQLPKPRPNQSFRQLWVILSKIHSGWKNHLILVNPETVIKWHRTAFKRF
ncbi:hypothetical protein [Pontibacillus chungwhensis]|uniref:hypothetical protein n=1 Tax=Pontibacillus chungwhensis TaxID=265426 RepID=UPI0018DBE99D|nr:hypothetical protein [Pontibacillus chungwhensis]